jgi:hypothetical protein
MRFLLISLLLAFAVAVRAQSIQMLVQSSPLAGFDHYSAGSHFADMQLGEALTLVREPDNPYDVNAVRVEWHGEKLGYLPRRENRAVAAEMDRGGQVKARIAALKKHPNPRLRLLIEVFVVL